MGDVILTGLPRSGTTLLCELLNLVQDTVALDEAMDWWSFTGVSLPARPGSVPFVEIDRAEIGANIGRFFTEARTSIRTRGVAPSKHVDGKVLGRKVSDRLGASRLRIGLAERGQIRVDKELSEDFLLAIKHVAGFTALLEPLLDRFPVYAIIRNPLAVLSSWQTVRMPIRDGHVVFGELLDRSLALRLSRIDDCLARQLEILGWFFGRFHELLAPGSVLRYEHVVADGGRALSAVTDRAAALQVPLESRNRNTSVYDAETTRRLGKRLLETDGPWWHFYTPDCVEDLVGDA